MTPRGFRIASSKVKECGGRQATAAREAENERGSLENVRSVDLVFSTRSYALACNSLVNAVDVKARVESAGGPRTRNAVSNFGLYTSCYNKNTTRQLKATRARFAACKAVLDQALKVANWGASATNECSYREFSIRSDVSCCC
jgi:hypothetical protein